MGGARSGRAAGDGDAVHGAKQTPAASYVVGNHSAHSLHESDDETKSVIFRSAANRWGAGVSRFVGAQRKGKSDTMLERQDSGQEAKSKGQRPQKEANKKQRVARMGRDRQRERQRQRQRQRDREGGRERGEGP